jgi:hypothetical protein
MHLLSFSEIKRVAGGDAFCVTEVAIWGTSSGAVIGAMVAKVASPTLGLVVGALVAGMTLAFAAPTLCDNPQKALAGPPHVS